MCRYCEEGVDKIRIHAFFIESAQKPKINLFNFITKFKKKISDEKPFIRYT